MISTTVFDGWELDVGAAEEPRVRDIEIASRAAMKKPRAVREIIARNREELEAHGDLAMRLSKRRSKSPTNTGVEFEREVPEYWLNEGQAIALVALMRTDKARDLRIGLVKMFVAYRRGMCATPTPVNVFPSVARIGDDPLTRRDLGAWCVAVSKACRVSLNRVHGHVRKTYTAPGIYAIPRVLHDGVIAMLQALVRGDLLFPQRPTLRLRPAAKPVTSLELPFPKPN